MCECDKNESRATPGEGRDCLPKQSPPKAAGSRQVALVAMGTLPGTFLLETDSKQLE